jgi:hypothetical protein
MHKHHESGLGESPREALEPMFLHPRIAMGHGDGGARERFCLRREEPPAEAIAAPGLEFYVASPNHRVLRG